MASPFAPGARVVAHWVESNSTMVVDVIQSKSPDRPDDLWVPLGDQFVQFWDAVLDSYSPLFLSADSITPAP